MLDTGSQRQTHGQPHGTPYEAISGARLGDRRVRLRRPPRTAGQRMSTFVRRVLAARN